MSKLHEMAAEAREAFYMLSNAPLAQRNAALRGMAEALEDGKAEIFRANGEDLQEAQESQLAAPLMSRLKFGEEKLAQVIQGLRSLEALPDVLGKTQLATEITEGLKMYRVSCAIGVIGIIFESRPDALVQIASLAVRSGNSALLKGGREALRTNRVLHACLRQGIAAAGLPQGAIQLMETREDVGEMLKEDELIDLIIPRGSNAFVKYIMDNSRIPVLGHADGLCHVYIDWEADCEKAWKVALDSKTQNVSVCNAMETLLVHREIAEQVLPRLARLYREKGVRLLGDAEVQRLTGCEAATEEDWQTEYLDYTLSIRTVDSVDEAIRHINRYGSHHTDAIITENEETAARFLREVDSAGVYWNVSTRFADGFVYGFGAEVGIATGKIHARGPMGLEGLTTYKYKLIGDGQTMAEMKDGTRQYTHRGLDENCPV